MVYFSVFDNEQELLNAILILNNIDQIDLDPMFFKGNFYKKIRLPKIYGDLNPINNIPNIDATDLNILDNSINSIILDPPFMFGIHGKSDKYYSSKTHGIFKNYNSLIETYTKIISEAYRVLRNNGILIFKCQDYTDTKTSLIHCEVYNIAKSFGFYAKDLAILNIKRGKVYNSKLKQRHLRKSHSYFFVFKKE